MRVGFGIYREPTAQSETGLIQMFDNPKLWTDVGYEAVGGKISEGEQVVLKRTEETSPPFLENHSSVEELIQFHQFENEEEQASWLVTAILKNLREDELRHDDIMVVNPDPLSTRTKVRTNPPTPSRERNSLTLSWCRHGRVSTFYRQDAESITLTGIYRAKGNEAGMVYVINAQDCNPSAMNLASIRNQLFTAIG